MNVLVRTLILDSANVRDVRRSVPRYATLRFEGVPMFTITRRAQDETDLSPSTRLLLAASLHRELYRSTIDGEPIEIRCWCAIGHDHTYDHWVQQHKPDTRPPLL